MGNIVRSGSKPGALELVKKLNTWKRGGKPAPHKPLLLLIALSRIQQGKDRLCVGGDIIDQLKNLLKLLPGVSSNGASYPLWYLKNDGLWDITNKDVLLQKIKEDKKDQPSAKDLRNAYGGLPLEIFYELKNDPLQLVFISSFILDEYFSTHDKNKIAGMIGIDLTFEKASKLKDENQKRDSKFREIVLNAYNQQCAVCEFDGNVDRKPISLEACHIKPFNNDGPCVLPNGISLCTFHHSTFDDGVIGFRKDRDKFKVIVSKKLEGVKEPVERLKSRHDKDIYLPSKRESRPSEEFINWHFKEIFVGSKPGKKQVA